MPECFHSLCELHLTLLNSLILFLNYILLLIFVLLVHVYLILHFLHLHDSILIILLGILGHSMNLVLDLFEFLLLVIHVLLHSRLQVFVAVLVLLNFLLLRLDTNLIELFLVNKHLFLVFHCFIKV